MRKDFEQPDFEQSDLEPECDLFLFDDLFETGEDTLEEAPDDFEGLDEFEDFDEECTDDEEVFEGFDDIDILNDLNSTTDSDDGEFIDF